MQARFAGLESPAHKEAPSHPLFLAQFPKLDGTDKSPGSRPRRSVALQKAQQNGIFVRGGTRSVASASTFVGVIKAWKISEAWNFSPEFFQALDEVLLERAFPPIRFHATATAQRFLGEEKKWQNHFNWRAARLDTAGVSCF